MAAALPDREWSPSSPPVTEPDFATCRVLVLHYWARWNLHDREMDNRLARLRPDFEGRVCFRSCDVDRVENRPWVRGIANVPALGCFLDGKWFKSLVGMRCDGELRSTLAGWIAAAAPA